MEKFELVFIPSPGFGHLISMVEFANRLLARDDRLSVTFLVIHSPVNAELRKYTESLASSSDAKVKYIDLPSVDLPPSTMVPEKFISVFIEDHKSHVKRALTELTSPVKVLGVVLDLFCTSMIDVADELGINSYMFFTSGAAFLGFMLHLSIRNDQIGREFKPSDPDAKISSYVNTVPTNVLPGAVFDKGGYESFVYHGTRFSETKGIIVNTFSELEPHAMNSMISLPPVYPVGPVLDLYGRNPSKEAGKDKIMAWLDQQPASSVIFLCFGSYGCFNQTQLEQITLALDQSGHRFLWSFRLPPPKGKIEMPKQYENVAEVLPKGFLERTMGRGIVCGWAPQVEVLAHKSVGGFVSHCGWNSILESLWFGIPILTWPLYAEQQLNAFELVVELGLAVELRLDSKIIGGEVVLAEEIEKAMKNLMTEKGLVRKRVKEMSEKSRKAVIEGGSSFLSIGRLIDDMVGNFVET